MTIATKTILLQMRFIRAGAPFCNIGAKETIDATNFDYSYKGNTFYGVSTVSDPVPTYPSIPLPVRYGSPFRWSTANVSIDASSDYVTKGTPFYVYYSGITPVTFNATRMFLVF